MLLAGRMNAARTLALLLLLSIIGHFAVDNATQARPASLQTAASPATSGRDPVIMAAGDIACGGATLSAKCMQNATADLVVEANPDAVLTLGDNQYECGQLTDYMASFDPSWGRFKEKIHPVPGNHEYQVSKADGNCPNAEPSAPGYYTYFGDAATPLEPGCRVACKGYYSWDIGTWHFIALNGECTRHGVGGCNPGSPQYRWLVDDLAKHQTDCTLAYWHEPRFSSGHHGSFPAYEPFWDALYNGGADVVLNGHDHDYERFAPQSPNGGLDDQFGIREFVVGTGGRNHTGLGNEDGPIANSEVFDNTTFGVLQLALHSNGYDWQFVPAVDEASTPFTDSGSGTCHGTPPDNRATPIPATPVSLSTPVAGWVPFVDGFESGTLANWIDSTGLVVQSDDVASGKYAVEATTTGPAVFARKRLSVPQPEIYYCLKFKVINRKPETVNILKFRTPDDESIISFGLGPEGNLVFRNDSSETSFRSDTEVTNGTWHEVQIRLMLNGDDSMIEVWFDGFHIDDLSRIESFDAKEIGYIQIGENSSRTGFDIVFDDVEVDTHFIPPEGPDIDEEGG
jgi:Calcineurin-like phosphoesterase